MLAAKVATDKSTLDRLAVSELLTFAGAVKAAAEENAAALQSDFLIKADALAAHAQAITALDGLKTAPRDAIVNRKVATMTLPSAIVFVRGIYRNELDKMMSRFKKSSPDFYIAYFAARIIIDRRGGKATPAPTPPPGGP